MNATYHLFLQQATTSLTTAATAVAVVTADTTDLFTTTGATVVNEPTYSVTEVIIIGTIAALLSIITVVGNIMVMISFKIDKQLQIISNYFLFSLAIADFAIGLISMPLFTVYTLLGYWPLGPMVCDTWLALDYLASNASVLNLLIISFDRYFSVTRPLTYRAKRTTKRVAIMIGCAWGISLLLWPPWIYSWPYIEGERTVPDKECYIQFIETNHYITFGTAIAAFYVPVTVMCALYWRIWRETEKRKKDLPNLQAGKKDSSKRSNSSDEQNNACSTVDLEEWRRPRSESSTGADNDSVYMHSSVCVDPHRRRPGVTNAGHYARRTGFFSSFYRIRAWCIAWWHSGREDSDTEEESPSEQGGQGCITPVSLDTPLQSSVSRCTSLNVIRDPYASGGGSGMGGYTQPTHHPHHHRELFSFAAPSTPTRLAARDSRSLPASAGLSTVSGGGGTVVSGAVPGAAQGGGGGLGGPGGAGTNHRGRSMSTDSVYTILIRLPGEASEGGTLGGGTGVTTSCGGAMGGGLGGAAGMVSDAPTIRMIPDTAIPRIGMTSSSGVLRGHPDDYLHSHHLLGGVGGGGINSSNHHLNRRPSAMPDIRIPLNAKIIPKQLGGPGSGGPGGGGGGGGLPSGGAGGGKAMLANATKNQGKKKKKTQEKKADKKAAKTLSAILLTFIITWTPYNILVLLKPVTSSSHRIPPQLWDFFYALCYINSTINPMCYALCNASFRRTYLRILKCKWHSRQRTAMNRGFYN